MEIRIRKFIHSSVFANPLLETSLARAAGARREGRGEGLGEKKLIAEAEKYDNHGGMNRRNARRTR